MKLTIGLGEYEDVPSWESDEDWDIMAAFVRTVRSPGLRENLSQGIRGRGAFRSFRQILDAHPAEEERWYQFLNASHRKLIEEWLESLGIVPDWTGHPPSLDPLGEDLEDEDEDRDEREEQEEENEETEEEEGTSSSAEAFDKKVIEEVTLALLWLHGWKEEGVTRTWKSHAWSVMDSLHEKGWISQPRGKAKSVVLTGEGDRRGSALAEQYFRTKRNR